MLTGPADDGILLMSTIVDDPSLQQARHLAGSGPQLACGCSKEGSPGALDAGRRRRGFDLRKSDPGNVDLLRTMPLPDSAANAGTPMPKNIVG